MMLFLLMVIFLIFDQIIGIEFDGLYVQQAKYPLWYKRLYAKKTKLKKIFT